MPEQLFIVSRLESKGANVCKSCRSRQKLSNQYSLSTCKNRLRYSQERASQSLPNISQQLGKSSNEHRLRLYCPAHRHLVQEQEAPEPPLCILMSESEEQLQQLADTKKKRFAVSIERISNRRVFACPSSVDYKRCGVLEASALQYSFLWGTRNREGAGRVDEN